MGAIVDKIKGRAKQVEGKVTGDKVRMAQGTVEKAKGDAKNMAARAARKVKGSVRKVKAKVQRAASSKPNSRSKRAT